MLYHRGWLFVGRDGYLYRAEHDEDDWTLGDPEYPDANGWQVSEVTLEHWGRVFPLERS